MLRVDRAVDIIEATQYIVELAVQDFLQADEAGACAFIVVQVSCVVGELVENAWEALRPRLFVLECSRDSVADVVSDDP